VADTLPGLGVGPDDEDSSAGDDTLADLEEEPQSGLGRGLAAIIPTLADLDTPPPAGRRRRRRGGVAALLGAPAEAPQPVADPRSGPGADDPSPPPPPPPPPDAAGRVEGAGPVEADPPAGADPGGAVGQDAGGERAPGVVAGGERAPGVVAGGERAPGVVAGGERAPGVVAGSDAGRSAEVAEAAVRSDPEVAEAAVRSGLAVEAEAEPDPEVVHVPAPSAVRKLRDDLVGALLDGLANTMALDLCAYLHQGPGEDPLLFMKSPALEGIGPERAYTLFDALRVDLEAGRSEAEFAAAGFRGVAVATVGDGSRGLWAVARTEDITTPEREVASRFCRSFGRAVHQLDGAAAPANTIARPLRVEVHRSRDSVLAEVQVRIGDQIRPGHGRAATRVEAITRAVLVAAGHHVIFRYASEVAHEGERAAVVLLEAGDHAVALGSALSPESGGVATAQAALRALDGLTP